MYRIAAVGVDVVPWRDDVGLHLAMQIVGGAGGPGDDDDHDMAARHRHDGPALGAARRHAVGWRFPAATLAVICIAGVLALVECRC